MTKDEIKQPKISILIPVYNTEKFINRCLTSVVNNTIISDCEIIIVNDCSPDASLSLIEDFIQSNKHRTSIKLISHDVNQGLAEARNTGLKEASGKYIICVDSDDWVEPLYLERLYNHAEENNLEICCCDYFINTDSSQREISVHPGSNPSEVLNRIARNQYFGYLWIKLIRKDLFDKNNICWIPNINLYEDLVSVIKLLCYTTRIGYIKEPLYHYYMNESSIVHTFNEKKAKELCMAVSELKGFFEHNSFTQYESALISIAVRVNVLIVLKGNFDPNKYIIMIPLSKVLKSNIKISDKLMFITLIWLYKPIGKILSMVYKKIYSL